MRKILATIIIALLCISTFSILAPQVRASDPSSSSHTSDPTDDLYYYLDGLPAPTWGAIDIVYSEISQIDSTHIRLLTETAEPIPLTNQWQSFYWILDTGYSTSGWESLGGNLLDSNDLTVAYFVTVSWAWDGSLYVRYSIFWDGTGTQVLIEDARGNPTKYFDGNKVFLTLPLSAIGYPSSIEWVAGSSDGVGGSTGKHDKAPNSGHIELQSIRESWVLKQMTKNDVEDTLGTWQSISGDGRRIVFDRRPPPIWGPEGYGVNWDVFTMNVTDEAGQEKQMTSAYGEDVGAGISFDGNTIAFASGRFHVGEPWDLEIFAMNFTDSPGQEVQISDNTTYLDSGVSISGDGKTVAWHTGPDTPLKHAEYITIANISDKSHIAYTIIDTPEWDSDPTLSFDGKKVCFRQFTDQINLGVFIANTDGTGITRIPGALGQGVISGDGSKVAVLYNDGDWEFSVFDVATGNQIFATDNSVDDWFGSINYHGNIVAYTRGGEIFTRDLQTMQETRLTNDAFEDWYPRLDEDGDTIAFVSIGRDGPDSEIFVMSKQRRFDPLIDGFGFNNPPLTPKAIQSIIDIFGRLKESSITDRIPDMILGWTIFIMERDSKGLCGGMVDAAIHYFEHPETIPDGYEQLVDVPQDLVLGTIEDFQIGQFFDSHGLLKQLLLRLGDDPAGLLSLDDEVAWIKQQTDQHKLVKLMVRDPDFSFFSNHAVLAYDVKTEDDGNILIEIYGPNRHKEKQWIELTRDENGKLKILNDQYPLDGFVITRFSSEDGPTTLDWSKVAEYSERIVAEIIEWIKDHLKDLWNDFMVWKEQARDSWDQFVDWVMDNAKGVWKRIIHFKLHSACDLNLYDSMGQHVGLSPTGDLDQGFDALYLMSNELQYCAVVDPAIDGYFVELVGTETGSYTLDTAMAVDGTTITESTFSGTIVQGAIYVYRVTVADETVVIKPDPTDELGHLKDFINGLPASVFDNFRLVSQRKGALFAKIDEVILKIEAGNYTDAINKLSRDIRAKMDGDPTARDWITDPTAQFKLCVMIDHIISNIQTLQEETG
jgi:Tol biopolymer transport system component